MAARLLETSGYHARDAHPPIVIAVCTPLACTSSTAKPAEHAVQTTTAAPARQKAESVRLSAELEVPGIAPGIAMHTTWKELPGIGLFLPMG